jgi:hypothetical protein
MSKKRLLALISLVLLVAVFGTACGGLKSNTPAGPTAPPAPGSAASFLPNLAGYTRTNASSITSALTTVGADASLLSGNAVTAAIISRIDGMISCYERVGAVAAAIYTDVNITQVTSGQTPKLGAIAIINQTELTSNFLSCALGSGFSAASADQPCAGSGSFVANNQTITYLYGATSQETCNLFAASFPH